MSRIETKKDRVKTVVEEVAEEFIMADPADTAFLERLSGTFARIAEDLAGDFPICTRAAQMTEDLLRKRCGNGGALSDKDMAAVEQTISAIQTLAAKDIEETELSFPPDFGPAAASEPAVQGKGEDLASNVDQEILAEYLVQQEGVVSEMESLVLSYEQDGDPQVLKALKRLLHTAKGEAGVLGLNHIEKLCHRVEDYIQASEERLKADLLLEFKDWYEQSIAAIRNDQPAPPADALLAALEDEGGAEEKGPLASPGGEADPGRADEGEAAPVKEAAGPAAMDETHEALLSPVEIEDPEITADFISEAYEHFESSDENLLILENDPDNEEAIACIFRAFHTIKGTTSFLGLTPISELAHKAENLLDEVRKKRLDFDGPVVDATFHALDLLKSMTRELETALAAGGTLVPDAELPSVFEQLKRAIQGSGATGGEGGKEAVPAFSETSEKPEPDGGPAGPAMAGEAAQPAAAEAAAPQAQGGGGAAAASGKAVKQTMKIDADRIDLLLETIGELVIVESIVSQEAALRNGESRELERNLGQLTKITRSLQDMGMSMRLIPIDNTFRKMGRLVRDLAKKSGKKIELAMEGRETELDKAMVEKLGDPLVHMVRNAVDHGIEPTIGDREKAGKNPTATILLKAYHQGGNIHIDIKDDGRGLDREAISAKAIERGLISSADGMSDEEIFSLIFEPGFSTAKQITDVSGRGVGMDVVKSNIESMRGNVRIASEKGVGSTFTLVLPLTMAIIDGMIVRVGTERYILPLLSIIESFQPTRDMITTVSGKGETVPFRNRLLPMFRLAELFGVSDAQHDPEKALVVVVEDAGRQVALMVDELLGQNQTVIKNLGEGLKDIEGIAGASIMPDGLPGLIIDVNGLVKMAML
jgi:two-component system chemotaxis sensor kinase CheA